MNLPFRCVSLLTVLIVSSFMYGQKLPHCQTRDLTIIEGNGGAAMHNTQAEYEITNHASHACTLSGYPTAVALNSEGKVVREIVFQHFSARRDASNEKEIPTIRLAPGGHAWFEIDATDPTGLDDTSFCNKATMVRVTPPQNNRPFQRQFEFSTCGPGSASISFLLAGEPD